MKRVVPLIRTLGMALVIACSLCLALLALGAASPYGGYDLLLARLLTGFYFFLKHNLPAISSDAGTWGPGLAAFLIFLGVGHWWLAAWAAKTRRLWNFATSLCLALAVPVLFVISFLVPGVLLQWDILREVPWIELR